MYVAFVLLLVVIVGGDVLAHVDCVLLFLLLLDDFNSVVVQNIVLDAVYIMCLLIGGWGVGV